MSLAVSVDKLVIVTRRTRLDDLVARFNTRAQGKFYLERRRLDFSDYQNEHDTYYRAVDQVMQELDLGLKRQVLDRSLVPTYSFGPTDVIVTIGQDGLVANTAKYALGRPIVAINPDPQRFDGILLPFSVGDARAAVQHTLAGEARIRQITLAEAALTDQQSLLAFNDLFIGARSHVSARYRLTVGDHAEPQSSSGVLVSTGAGSTGWMSSVFNMASGVTAIAGGQPGHGLRLEWDDPRLFFAVREAFASRHSATSLVAGYIEPGTELALESLMPSGGAIFSDGIESDFLEFNSGAVAHVRAAATRARLVVRDTPATRARRL